MENLFFLIGGLALLLAGGETLVRGAVGLSRRLGLSKALIGVTIMGFGTSMPELVTSIEATLSDAPGIAIGNVLGSNTANILLILGLAAIVRPLSASRALRGDLVVMLAATVLGGLLLLRGTLGSLEAIILLAGFMGFVISAVWRGRAQDEVDDEAPPSGSVAPLVYSLMGLGMVLLGAKLTVSGGIGVANGLGVPPSIIGLSVIAVGTSLPELAASVAAARKGHGDLALGNILGSNIFNLLAILGISAAARPLQVPDRFLSLDLWITIGSAFLLLILPALGWRMPRIAGLIFVFLYVGYVSTMGG
ncbi:calcium/sodium antiporter [Loktanella sp. IMCC34160]|uniref:calcium/sodium antiporter n=1 Tax=Loktanella sp. IMCC34160 TaxID=2510646 RepID=UPI0013EA9944|nr:calcium/sodium antiporter [Loktanella sp. IMCC34160]